MEHSHRWLQDKGNGKGSEEDVLTKLLRRWLQEKGNGGASQKDAPAKLSQ